MDNIIPIKNDSEYINFITDRTFPHWVRPIFSVPFTCYEEKPVFSTYNFDNRYPSTYFKIEKSNHYIARWIYDGPEKLDYKSWLYRKQIFDTFLDRYLHPGGMYDQIPESPTLTIRPGANYDDVRDDLRPSRPWRYNCVDAIPKHSVHIGVCHSKHTWIVFYKLSRVKEVVIIEEIGPNLFFEKSYPLTSINLSDFTSDSQFTWEKVIAEHWHITSTLTGPTGQEQIITSNHTGFPIQNILSKFPVNINQHLLMPPGLS